MKILFLVNSAWSAFNFRLNLAKSVSENNFEIFFLIPNDGNYFKRISRKYKTIPLYLKNKNLNPFDDLRTILNISRVIKEYRIDILLTFSIKLNIYGSFVSAMMGKPSIANINGLGSVFIKNGLVSIVANTMYKFALKFPQKIFFHNAQDYLLFQKKFNLPEKRIDIIPGSGVNLSRFYPRKDKKHFGNNFLFIGRLIKDKGIIEIIEAVKILNLKNNLEFKIDFLGDFDENNPSSINRSCFYKWIDEGLIRYLGTSDKVEEFIENYDCVILPSYREGMPRVILEAFAMKVPAIVTNVPGCQDIVSNRVDGLVCNAHDANDLANRVIEFIELSAETKIRMGNMARKKVENFYDEKIVIEKYLSTLEKLKHL